jgi:hypothetical protein
MYGVVSRVYMAMAYRRQDLEPLRTEIGGDVPFQSFGQAMCFPLYFEDLDRAVGRASRKAPAVVIEDCIVL